MRYIYRMQNLTFGSDGGLTKACQRKFAADPGLCFMSPHMVDTIQTPLFIFNSKCAESRGLRSAQRLRARVVRPPTSLAL